MVKVKSTKTKTKSSSKSKGTSNKEQFKVASHEILKKVKELIKEGNVRRIIIKNEKGKTLMEIPVTVAVIGVVVAPILAAVGALAALVNQGTIEVDRK
ncbi:DUF4342 domain-containing protein [Candidatus Falkowbacteria bacterium]|uniref:DUF4342 domain-containing protein n=1 Tax=Candidatus Falkowbacteria bacterium CG10_big_fil_rev_8_21_14_0_10_37_18 TaxID=1974562 RepID=A0A2H0V9F7_9BACT|nr:DUF4342 domain-containing protein [Candidatus Falkowbacteria bacterium]NCQ12885.1 DUF4342 domain-containing protein [Candidatus Falkowbacteria bacterium]PIR95736.1 MAG: hypothetical protein COT93_00785 [Candidatus Falkowbacteria bacterium CG10_big_fil_rev_8_21_14_0_10_37_18]